MKLGHACACQQGVGAHEGEEGALRVAQGAADALHHGRRDAGVAGVVIRDHRFRQHQVVHQHLPTYMLKFSEAISWIQ